MNTQKHRQNDEKSAAKKLPKNTAVLGAKTACKNRAKFANVNSKCEKN